MLWSRAQLEVAPRLLVYNRSCLSVCDKDLRGVYTDDSAEENNHNSDVFKIRFCFNFSIDIVNSNKMCLRAHCEKLLTLIKDL